MPCWSRFEMSMDLGKVDMDSMRLALEELGQQPVMVGAAGMRFNQGYYDRATGEITLQGMRGAQAKDWTIGLKKRIAVNNAAKSARKMGWSVTRVSPTQIQLSKR